MLIQTACNHKKIILIYIFIFLIGIVSGALLGHHYYKKYEYAGAVGLWMMGVQELEKHEYDYTLYYTSQAIGIKNDDALFYETMAQIYEAKNNVRLAIFFYETAITLYKRENTVPIKKIENKIKLLQEQGGQK